MDVPADILTKLEHFCAFQERCESEVRKKLTTMPCSVAQRDEIIRRLREHDFLNDQRYVETFVRSKIHEQWGKLKIRQALHAKSVDAQLIDEYLEAIDEDDYKKMLGDAIDKWKRQHKADENDKPKLFRYLLTRGFSTSEVMDALKA
ncbi:MAG: RecX family transcriptional regulator [Bacteroidales bacterium]|nr:RecX family transcriptional regulator [Bacteroidales bacterium]